MDEEYISQRNFHNDWMGESERDIYQQILAYLEEYHRKGMLSDKSYWELREEYMHKFYDAEKAEIDRIKSEMDGYISRIEKSVNKLLADEKKLIDARKKTLALEKSQTQAIIDIEKGRIDVANEVAAAQREISTVLKVNKESYKYLDDELRKTIFNEDDYDVLSKKLGEISSQADILYNDYWKQIHSLTEDEAYLAEFLTSEYSRQNTLLVERYRIASAELELEKARLNLYNTQAERSVRIFLADTGTFQWVADPNAIKTAMEKMAETEDALLKAKQDYLDTQTIQQQEKILDSLKREEASMDATFEALEAQWAETIEYIRELHEPTEEINSILKEIAENQTPELQSIISQTSEAVKQFIEAIRYEASKIPSSSGTVGNPLSGPTTAKTPSYSSGSSGSSYSSGLDTYSSPSSSLNEGTIEAYVPGIGTVNITHDKNGSVTTTGLPVGTEVYTAGGDYEIVAPNTPGANYNPKNGYWSVPIYDTGGILKGLGGIKATKEDEIVLGPDITSKALEPQKSAQFVKLVDGIDKLLNITPEGVEKLKAYAFTNNIIGDSLRDSFDRYNKVSQGLVTNNNQNNQVQHFHANINGIVKEVGGDTKLSELFDSFQRLVPLRGSR